MNERMIAEQVAVLAERVEVQNQNNAELKGMLMAVVTGQNELSKQIAVQAKEQEQRHNNEIRLFQLADAHGKKLDDHTGTLRLHGWTWKLVGSAAMLAISLGGYVFSQFESLKATDSAYNNRLTLLEFIVGGRQSTPPAQPTELPKK